MFWITKTQLQFCPCPARCGAGVGHLKGWTVKTQTAVVIAMTVLIAILFNQIGMARNQGLYYPGRYYVARNIEGHAVIVDLETATARAVRINGAPLKLAVTNWSSGNIVQE